MKPSRRAVYSWALYDWANSAFATTVMAGFFPVALKQLWADGLSATDSTLRLGIANSTASLVIVVLAPVLGAIADQLGAKKRFLVFFALIGIVMTGLLPLVARGEWLFAVVLYVFAVIGFSGANIFYDALIFRVADERDVDYVSALGFALGYLGGGLLFGLDVWMVSDPGRFGLAGPEQALQLAFASVAAWWAVFSVPIVLYVHEPPVARRGAARPGVADGLRQLARTFAHVRRLRTVFLFLVAYWFYIDGVDTVVKMAVDYGISLGLPSDSLVLALLVTQFVGFPAAIVFGRLGGRIGAKAGIFIGIGVYIAVCVWASRLDTVAEFYAIAATVGLVQGGVQALSRSFYTRLIPADKAAEFFGFYNMLGKFATVLGPVLMGWIGVVTGNPRASIYGIVILFVIGGALLFFVDERKGRADARALAAT